MPSGSRTSFLSKALVAALLSIAVAGCGATGKATRSSRAEIDPKLGVAPSPRVVRPGDPVPKGGGRSMVGRPYVVGGKRYVPGIDPSYSRVGLASWYGDAFHGRRTANGEVFDANHLSAAHPTMPLPSYARVTSLTTGRSVMVRVNDRGPFHSNRLIDISRRTAEVLGVRASGIAKVQVDYVGPAPVDGDDTRYLMASLRGGEAPPSGPGETLLAAAGSLPGVAAVGSTISAATHFITGDDEDDAPVMARRAAPSLPAAVAPAVPATVGSVMIAGDVLPPTRPAVVEETYVVVASADPADAFMAAGGPIQVAALMPPAAEPAMAFSVGPQPVEDRVPSRSPIPSSYAADRVDQAYAAVADVGEGVGLADLTRSLEQLAEPRAVGGDDRSLLVGVFGNPENSRRVATALGDIGTVAIDQLVVGGRPMERVRVTALRVDDAAAVAAAVRAGADGARIER